MIHEPEVKCDYFETMDIEIQLSKLTTSLRVTEIKDENIKRLLFNDKFQVHRYFESLFLNHENSFLKFVYCLYWTKDEEINTNEYIPCGFICKNKTELVNKIQQELCDS